MPILRRITNLFHQSKLDEEIEAELRAHIEMRTADNIAAGMPPEKARRDALMRFGNRVTMKERVTEADAQMCLDSLWQDLRYGLRMLRKSPGFTTVAVLTLSLGIGANTAIFSLVNAALFRELPYRHAERLAFLWQNNQRTGETEGTVSYPNFADWRAQSHSFEDMAFISGGEVLLGKGGVLQHVSLGEVSTNFLSVLGISPLLGRDFTYSDALPGPTHVLLIGYNLWQTYYGGDPHIIGRPVGSGLSANSIIIGVMPRGFSFPPGTEVWKPREADDYLRTKSRPYPFFKVIGRLHAGVTWTSAQAEIGRAHV